MNRKDDSLSMIQLLNMGDCSLFLRYSMAEGASQQATLIQSYCKVFYRLEGLLVPHTRVHRLEFLLVATTRND